MKLEQINEQAKQSLNKYFKNAYELKHSEGLRKEVSYYEMMNMIQDDIIQQEEKLHELNMMKSVLEHDAKGVYEYIFGENNEAKESVHHDNMSEMRKKLNENMEQQFSYVDSLKQKVMNQ